jgi:TPR repeat protein
MYEYGLGVPQDYIEAVKWYQSAADQGYAKAQYNLGLLHANGRGVPQDFIQAHLWLNLAAQSLSVLEPKDLEDAIASRNDIAARLTPEQLDEAQRRAREWLSTHPKS